MPINPTWIASLERQLVDIREALRKRDPAEVARLAGAACPAGENSLQLFFWNRRYSISWPDLTVCLDSGESCSAPTQAVLLMYLLQANGAPIENSWVSLRNLPNGAFYEQAFQGYSGNLIARAFRGDPEGFRAIAQRLEGEPVNMGDGAYRFWALPRIPLALVFWSGGEEFPDWAQVLFDNSARHYHQVEVLAHLGAMLCERVIQAREKR